MCLGMASAGREGKEADRVELNGNAAGEVAVLVVDVEVVTGIGPVELVDCERGLPIVPLLELTIAERLIGVLEGDVINGVLEGVEGDGEMDVGEDGVKGEGNVVVEAGAGDCFGVAWVGVGDVERDDGLEEARECGTAETEK
jgi:hypothetical protein